MSAKPVSAIPYIDLALLDSMLDRLTANLMIHNAHESIWSNVESLHRIAKQMRERLTEEQRQRTTEQLEASVEHLCQNE